MTSVLAQVHQSRKISHARVNSFHGLMAQLRFADYSWQHCGSTHYTRKDDCFQEAVRNAEAGKGVAGEDYVHKQIALHILVGFHRMLGVFFPPLE